MSQTDELPRSTARRRGRPVGSDSGETRNRILRAARRVINQRGYPAATFQAIAVEADLSRPTLHYYFSSREEIYDALIDEATGVMADCIARAGRGESLAASMTALVDAIVGGDDVDRTQLAFLISARLEASRNPELGYERGGALSAHLTSLVDDAVGRGELAADHGTGPIVDVLHSILWGMGLCAGVRESVDVGAVTARLATVLTHGLPVVEDVTGTSEEDVRDTYRDTPSGVGGRS
jgi:AcrR family transcriptional regulator